MIRILFTIPNFDSAGSGKALLNLALGLDKNRFEVHIACKTNSGDFFETVTKSGLSVHVFNYEAPMRPIKTMIKTAWQISRKLKEIKPDIIHSFHYNNNYGEAIAARLAGIPWIFTKKNMNWGSDGANAWKLRSRLATKIIIQNKEMKSRFYPNSRKTVLIERGIHLEKFETQEADEEVRKELKTVNEARIIIAVANLVPVKGIEHLVQAFSTLTATFPEWHLWLVGDDNTDTGSALKKVVHQKKLENRIHFAGKQHNVRSYLDHAELFVLPTKAVGEGSPVALLEAMANGKVVFGSSVPGIIDQLTHVPSHLFMPEDSIALAKCLEAFMKNDRATNALLGQSFKKYVTSKYSLQREVLEHENVYQSIVRNV